MSPDVSSGSVGLAEPFALVEDQTRGQALFAFTSDPTLNTVGIITTFWRYLAI